MLIIAGHLTVDPERRDAYVADCVEVIESARAAPGCLAYVVTSDPLDPAQVCVFERWESEDQLLAFRGSGPSDEQQSQVISADVKRYEISSVGDP